MKTVLKTLCLVSLAAGSLQAATNDVAVVSGSAALTPRMLPVASVDSPLPQYIAGSSSRSVLFSQMGIVATGFAAQDFEAVNDAFDCELADMFTVSGGSWSVDGLRVLNSDGVTGPAAPGATFNVRFYLADGPMGSPGTLVAQELGASFVYEGATNLITLAPVCLSNGDYYVGFQVTQDFSPWGQWFAGVLTDTGGNQWLNAGGGFGAGTVWATHPAGPNNVGFELEGSLNCGGASTDDLASSFALGQAFPNPFNPSTTINFSLAETANASLKVFNVTGAEVARLVSGLTAAGEHSVVFDAASLTSGVYYYTLDVNGAVQTRKMVLVK